jgi:hypothetical protein
MIKLGPGEFGMTIPTSQNLTQMLLAWGEGDEAARDALIPMVHDQLQRIARHHLRQERTGTLAANQRAD